MVTMVREKTTIFDCLCLVLFDQTPNLDGGYQSEEKIIPRLMLSTRPKPMHSVQLNSPLNPRRILDNVGIFFVTWAVSRSSR